MPKTITEFSTSKITTIEAAITPYRNGYVAFTFKPDIDLSVIAGDYIKQDPDIRILDTKHTIACINLKKVSDLSTYLMNKGYIAANEKPRLMRILQQVDRRNALKLSETVLQAQRDILLVTASPYIEDIIRNIDDIHVIVTLLRGISDHHCLPQFRVFLDSYAYESKEDIRDSLGALAKICVGEAQLEESYLRMSDTIPTLIAQRQEIAFACIKKIIEFKRLPDHLYFYAAFILIFFNNDLAPKVPLSTDLKEYFDNFFKEFLITYDANEAQITSDIKIDLAYNALTQIGITPDSPNFTARMKNIQNEMQSPILEEILRIISQKKSMREWKEHLEEFPILKAALPFHEQVGYLPLTIDRLYIYPQSKSLTALSCTSLLDSTLYSFLSKASSTFIINKKINVSNATCIMADTAYVLASGFISYQLCSDDDTNMVSRILMPAGLQLLIHGFNKSISHLAPINRHMCNSILTAANFAFQGFYQGLPQLLVTSTVASIGSFMGAKLAKRIPFTQTKQPNLNIADNSMTLFNQKALKLNDNALQDFSAGRFQSSYEKFRAIYRYWSQSIAENENAHSRDHYIKACYNLGRAAQKLNKLDEAIHCIQQAIDCSPTINKEYAEQLEECKKRQQAESSYNINAP